MKNEVCQYNLESEKQIDDTEHDMQKDKQSIQTNNYNFKEEKKDTISEVSKLYKNEILKKINNKKVNNTLIDIYGTISNINEISKKMKNLMFNYHSTNNYNFKNYDETIPTQKNDNLDNIQESNIQYTKEEINYNLMTNSTKKDFESNELSNGNNLKKEKNPRFNMNKNMNSNKTKIIKNKSFSISSKHNTKSNKNKSLEYLEEYKIKNEPKLLYDYSVESTEKSNYLEDDIKNEIEIENIKLKKKKEKKKLKGLEDTKNKLIKEEKIRRKKIVEKIKAQKFIQKQNMMKNYQKQINHIQKMQIKNINKIIELQGNKKIDEEKLMKLNELLYKGQIHHGNNQMRLYYDDSKYSYYTESIKNFHEESKQNNTFNNFNNKKKYISLNKKKQWSKYSSNENSVSNDKSSYAKSVSLLAYNLKKNSNYKNNQKQKQNINLYNFHNFNNDKIEEMKDVDNRKSTYEDIIQYKNEGGDRKITSSDFSKTCDTNKNIFKKRTSNQFIEIPK